MKSYHDLEIYTLAFDLSVRIRKATLALPNPDKYEVGGQLRRSSQTIKEQLLRGMAGEDTRLISSSTLFTVTHLCSRQTHRPNSSMQAILMRVGKNLQMN
jgi:hypothetical protein